MGKSIKSKNYSYIGISFIILLFGIYVIPKVAAKFTGNSSNLFKNKDWKVPSFELVDQNGITITNQSYEGKVFVVKFFFTNCPTICPEMTRQLKIVQKEFAVEANFGVASITIDPKNDTPKKMKQYADSYQIKTKNWHLLTGKSENYVYNLANLGFKLPAGHSEDEMYKSHGGLFHSGSIALIDKEGFIRSRFDENGNPIFFYNAVSEEGTPNQIDELIEDIKLLLNE